MPDPIKAWLDLFLTLFRPRSFYRSLCDINWDDAIEKMIVQQVDSSLEGPPRKENILIIQTPCKFFSNLMQSFGKAFIVKTAPIGRFHYLDRCHWLGQIYMFLVCWGLRLFGLLCMLGWFVNHSLFRYGVGTHQAWYLKDVCVCFLTSYSFSTISLFIV
jgi:hypothetical protein